MNMLPPPGFYVADALESIGQPLDRVSLDGFLSVVNGVWRAAEDLTSHDTVVRHAYEAFTHAREKKKEQSLHRSDAGGLQDSTGSDNDDMIDAPPTTSGSGSGKHPHHSGGTSKSSSDPVVRIVKSNMNRGLRNLQQFLSPSQGEPEMLRSFVNLGAADSGAGYMLDMARMAQKCADVGIHAKDLTVITKIFDPTNSGELDYDGYLQLMRSDLEKLGLKSKLLTQLRRVLFQKPPAMPSTATGRVSLASSSSPASPAVAMASSTTSAFGGAQQTTGVAAGSASTPARKRNASHRFSAAQFSPLDAFEGTSATPQVAATAELQDPTAAVGVSENTSDDMDVADDPLGSADLGKSFFHSIAVRQASIHEFNLNGGHAALMPLVPAEFFNKIHANLEQCRVELEGLREYEIEAQNLKLYGHRKARGGTDHRYQPTTPQPDATVVLVGSGSPRKQSLNSNANLHATTHGGQQHLVLSAQMSSSDGESLPRIHSTRRHSSNDLPNDGGATAAPSAHSRYGAGHNPAIPKYQYGVPPLPLIHWSPRTTNSSSHYNKHHNHSQQYETVPPSNPLTEGGSSARMEGTTPTNQMSRVNSSGTSSGVGALSSARNHTEDRSRGKQDPQLPPPPHSTLMESYYSFKQLLSPQMTPRSQVVAACGYAPTPQQALSGRRHPTASAAPPPPRTTNRTPEGGSPTRGQDPHQQQRLVRQPSPPLLSSPVASEHSRHQGGDDTRGTPIANNLEMKQSIYRLAGVDAAIEGLVSPMSPLSPHHPNPVLGGPVSPRNYPQSPMHGGRRTVSSAAIRALARASSMGGTLSGSHGGNSPRHTKSGRSSSKKLLRTSSSNRMLVAMSLNNEDVITDVDAAPAAIGGMMSREESLRLTMFEKDLATGKPEVLGKVSARLLKHQEHAVQAVYRHHVPRTTAQALLPKPPPRRNDPTAASAQAPPIQPKDHPEGVTEAPLEAS